MDAKIGKLERRLEEIEKMLRSRSRAYTRGGLNNAKHYRGRRKPIGDEGKGMGRVGH